MSTRPRTPAPATPAPGKLPLPELLEMKKRHDKIVMITAYDAPAARIADEAGVELILVGDTAAMVMLGHESTLPVTLDEMIFLTRAVTRAARRPLVVGDLPFGTYEVSDEQAVASAIRHGQGGRRGRRQARGRRPDALARARDRRLEHRDHGPRRPDAAVGHQARRLQGAGQDGHARRSSSSTTRSRCRRRARSRSSSRPCLRPSRRASRRRSTCRRSGSAPAPATDGQVLVWHDMLGMYAGRTPRFVKRYADIASEIGDAVSQYADDVRTGAFPEEQHTYGISPDELERFEAAVRTT